MKKIVMLLLMVLSTISLSSCEFDFSAFFEGLKDFGSKVEEGTDEFFEQAVEEILYAYDLNSITNDLTLPTEYGDIIIDWSSDNPALSNTGKVTRGEVDIPVVLTVVLNYQGIIYSLDLNLIVKGTGTGNNSGSDDNQNNNGGSTGGEDNEDNNNNDNNTDTDEDNNTQTEPVDPYLVELFGENVRVYSNGDTNPYGININQYGDNVDVIFYTPNYSILNDKYNHITTTTAKKEFYNSYTPSEAVEDAYFRTQHNLMSGDITDQGHIPSSLGITSNGKYVKATNATYVLDTKGNYLAYIPNVVDTDNHIVFYGAAYTALNDVAAYLLAFGEVPANSNYDKNSGKSAAISDWGKYGRVNLDKFSGNTSSYPYEPLLPDIVNGSYSPYYETDFGTLGGYVNENTTTGTYYNQTVYNTGSSISRGAARFVYYGASYSKNINDRYVFYTYNHYNDFQEYLNYDNGFGLRFGNETAGNQYCGNRSDYYESNKYPVTQYPSILELTLQEIIALYN